jgi:hypothetical protein
MNDTKEVLTKDGVKLVCTMFELKPNQGVKFISKSQLLVTVVKQYNEIRRLIGIKAMITTELFCSNPDHPLFEEFSELNLAPLRIEKINRHSGGGKHE